jgi:hypothetical protein
MKYMDFDQNDYYEDEVFNWNKLTKLLLYEDDSYL